MKRLTIHMTPLKFKHTLCALVGPAQGHHDSAWVATNAHE